MLAGAIPFFFLLETKSGQAALMAYLLTVLLGTVLIDNFRQTDSRWFWRAAIPVALIHVSVVLAIVWLDLSIPEINKMLARFTVFSFGYSSANGGCLFELSSAAERLHRRNCSRPKQCC